MSNISREEKEKIIRERLNLSPTEEVPAYVLDHCPVEQVELTARQLLWAKELGERKKKFFQDAGFKHLKNVEGRLKIMNKKSS